MPLRKLKKAAALVLATVLIATGITAQGATMLEAKSQQSALELQKEENSKSTQALKDNVTEKAQYIKKLEKNILSAQKDIDTVNKSLVKIDKAIAKLEAQGEEKPKATVKAREDLVKQKDEHSFVLQQYEELKKEAAALYEAAKGDEEKAKVEEDRIAKEQKKTDEAIDLWYAEYQKAQSGAGSSLENLGGDVYNSKGYFVWPIPGYTYITQYFVGDHRGIDIAGGDIYGKAIVSAQSGTVVYSDWMGSYGYVVFVDHGNGYQTRYAHMSALGCEVGDKVEANQVIGYIGSTGNSSGPHLHFEIIYNGSIYDPFYYF